MAHEVILGLTSRARQAVAELNVEFKKKLAQYKYGRLVVPIGVDYGKKLSDEYNRRLAAIVREGKVETSPDRMVRVKCPKCGREERIAGDVARWTCVCGPTERLAFQTYLEF